MIFAAMKTQDVLCLILRLDKINSARIYREKIYFKYADNSQEHIEFPSEELALEAFEDLAKALEGLSRKGGLGYE